MCSCTAQKRYHILSLFYSDSANVRRVNTNADKDNAVAVFSFAEAETTAEFIDENRGTSARSPLPAKVVKCEL